MLEKHLPERAINQKGVLEETGRRDVGLRLLSRSGIVVQHRCRASIYLPSENLARVKVWYHDCSATDSDRSRPKRAVGDDRWPGGVVGFGQRAKVVTSGTVRAHPFQTRLCSWRFQRSSHSSFPEIIQS